MRRIAGIVHFDRTRIASTDIQRMLTAMDFPKRGEQSIWTEAGVGLGCAHSLSEPGQPIEYLLSQKTNQSHLIAFDGRIDNRPELLAALKSYLTESRTTVPDEALVLAAYRKWGVACPVHLVGDFAFALWDKEENHLVCARDHFGVKPFYYFSSNTCFAFASAPHALFACGKVQVVIHEERIADFLAYPLEGVDKASSFYQDVFRLPPAHSLVVQARGVGLERYWELSSVGKVNFTTDDQYLEQFQALFTEAVRCRLLKAPPAASMLSGGMDSSAIVAVGRKILAEDGGVPLQAFAVVSDSPELNRESARINSVVAQGDLQPHLISEAGLLQQMDELVRAIEEEPEPFDCLMNLNRSVYLHARDQQLGALLDGVDGDILLSGSGHLTQLWRTGAFCTILDETFRAEGLTAEYKMSGSLFFNSLLSAFLPFAPEWFRELRHPYRYQKVASNALKGSIINREFALQSNLGERFATLDSHNPRVRSSSQMEFHKLTLDQPYLTVAFERYERVAATFGIEARHPFVDVRLAEFCLGLPWQLKTRRGWTKLILRRAMEPYLPPEVVWRADKDSLMWEVNRLILRERAEYFYQITSDERANLKPYIDMEKLMGFWDDYLTRGDETQALSLWSGIALAMWLRQKRKIAKETKK